MVKPIKLTETKCGSRPSQLTNKVPNSNLYNVEKKIIYLKLISFEIIFNTN